MVDDMSERPDYFLHGSVWVWFIGEYYIDVLHLEAFQRALQAFQDMLPTQTFFGFSSAEVRQRSRTNDHKLAEKNSLSTPVELGRNDVAGPPVK